MLEAARSQICKKKTHTERDAQKDKCILNEGETETEQKWILYDEQ